MAVLTSAPIQPLPGIPPDAVVFWRRLSLAAGALDLECNDLCTGAVSSIAAGDDRRYNASWLRHEDYEAGRSLHFTRSAIDGLLRGLRVFVVGLAIHRNHASTEMV